MEYHKDLTKGSIEYYCEIDKIEKIETWKDVPEYEGLYKVSDLGRVMTINPYRNPKVLRQSFYRYTMVTLVKDKKNKGFNVHSLVAMAFLGHIRCGHKIVINHKNFIKCDNRLCNIELITQRENTNKKHIHTKRNKLTGTYPTGKRFKANICINGRTIYLGVYDTELEASTVYENKLKEISQ